MHFHSLEVSDIIRETVDTVSVAFKIPNNLRQDYEFIPGQYLTLKTIINGEEIRRAYSICSAPHDNELRVAIKQVPNGVFSTYANTQLSVGDVIEVMTPTGHFVTQYDSANNFVLFAAGSGITPIVCILKHVLHTNPKAQVTLFYGNKDVDHIIFGKELDDLKNRYPSRFNFQLVFSQENRGNELFQGRIDQEKLAVWGKTVFKTAQIDEFFMCGPVSMTESIRAYLDSEKVDHSQVHFELFNAGEASEKVSTEGQKEPAKNHNKAQVKLIIDDEEYDFGLNAGEDILQAGVNAGVDLPYSCKGGVCCTCKAKLMEGTATMDMNYSLLDEEVAEGYILTCQAHPTSEKVVVSFDD